jgi:hypothetical protein
MKVVRLSSSRLGRKSTGVRMNDISARIRRLEQLSVGAARETQLVGPADIFLYVERRQYLTALHKMCARLENARVALAKARQRLDGKRR